MEPDLPRPYKCGVCVGYGAWYKSTGKPVNQNGLAPREDVQVCHYCHGTGRLHKPVFQ